MTTGRINQVTILTLRPRPPRPPVARGECVTGGPASITTSSVLFTSNGFQHAYGGVSTRPGRRSRELGYAEDPLPIQLPPLSSPPGCPPHSVRPRRTIQSAISTRQKEDSFGQTTPRRVPTSGYPRVFCCV
jgi:hypothetical protein